MKTTVATLYATAKDRPEDPWVSKKEFLAFPGLHRFAVQISNQALNTYSRVCITDLIPKHTKHRPLVGTAHRLNSLTQRPVPHGKILSTRALPSDGRNLLILSLALAHTELSQSEYTMSLSTNHMYPRRCALVGGL
jgi:hypothetical protein